MTESVPVHMKRSSVWVPVHPYSGKPVDPEAKVPMHMKRWSVWVPVHP